MIHPYFYPLFPTHNSKSIFCIYIKINRSYNLLISKQLQFNIN